MPNLANPNTISAALFPPSHLWDSKGPDVFVSAVQKPRHNRKKHGKKSFPTLRTRTDQQEEYFPLDLKSQYHCAQSHCWWVTSCHVTGLSQFNITKNWIKLIIPLYWPLVALYLILVTINNLKALNLSWSALYSPEIEFIIQP